MRDVPWRGVRLLEEGTPRRHVPECPPASFEERRVGRPEPPVEGKGMLSQPRAGGERCCPIPSNRDAIKKSASCSLVESRDAEVSTARRTPRTPVPSATTGAPLADARNSTVRLALHETPLTSFQAAPSREPV